MREIFYSSAKSALYILGCNYLSRKCPCNSSSQITEPSASPLAIVNGFTVSMSQRLNIVALANEILVGLVCRLNRAVILNRHFLLLLDVIRAQVITNVCTYDVILQ